MRYHPRSFAWKAFGPIGTVQRFVVLFVAATAATTARTMGARAFRCVGAAFVGGVCVARRTADKGHIWRGQHHARCHIPAIGAIGRIKTAAHGFDCFKRAAICALVFINGHQIILIRVGFARHRRRRAVLLEIGGQWHIDASIKELLRAIRIGHHVPFKDVIGQPKRSAGVGNIDHT